MELELEEYEYWSGSIPSRFDARLNLSFSRIALSISAGFAPPFSKLSALPAPSHFLHLRRGFRPLGPRVVERGVIQVLRRLPKHHSKGDDLPGQAHLLPGGTHHMVIGYVHLATTETRLRILELVFRVRFGSPRDR